jgi:hypothetical protein
MQSPVQQLLAFGMLAAFLTPIQAWAECGARGGPGYRGPNGQCVGWASIGKVCGDPPTTHCTPEHTSEKAPDAAKKGIEIENLRPGGRAPALLAQPTPNSGLELMRSAWL